MSATMPFGKFKGEPLSGIPDWYLEWLERQVDLREPLQSWVAAELRRRQQPPPVLDVDRWFRQLAVDWHPDRRGGSAEGMRALEAGRELLRHMLGIVE